MANARIVPITRITPQETRECSFDEWFATVVERLARQSPTICRALAAITYAAPPNLHGALVPTIQAPDLSYLPAMSDAWCEEFGRVLGITGEELQRALGELADLGYIEVRLVLPGGAR